MEYNFNEYQTVYDDAYIETLPKETQEQYYEILTTVPYVKRLIDAKRPHAKDLPRDEDGKIIIDITHPHTLEDMDYFRPSALMFQRTGRYTDLRPNPNPNSEYFKWISEEIRRCYDGYVRESDGEWITGDMYFFLNYCPIQLAKKDKSGKTIRTVDFPKVWDGHYYKFHYLNQCRAEGHHAMELASRGKGKSYAGAALLAKRFILGEGPMVNKFVQCVVTASEKKYIQGANQILDMFQHYIDYCATNTQFPSRRLTSSLINMQWTMGYIDSDTNTRKGTGNSVIGITSKDDESKLRGSRGVLYLLEEAGSFPRLLDLYSVLRPSVEDADAVWGMIFAYGTAGDSDSDFSSMQELMYNPLGYNIKGVENIYDKEGQGRKLFTYFFPGYLNMAECYDDNGNSDVTKAIMHILKDRYTVKYNSTKINALTKRIAEIPITPQEAIQRVKNNLFPVTELTERLNQIDNNPNFYDDVYVGELVFNSKKEIEFKPTSDVVIRNYPLKDNKLTGAIEIYNLPEKDSKGEVTYGRYILGHDPVDDDEANTMSLTSTFVFDLFTDKIVAEYTGRQPYADDNFEIVRKLCMFYNGLCLYENNKKGLFSYFSRMNCLHYLADTPDYLRDKDLIKTTGIGNKQKGVGATLPINNYANQLIRDWFLKPTTFINKDEDGNDVEITMPALYTIKSRALLKESILFNALNNFDRIRALGMVMLYRQEKLILYGGDAANAKNTRYDKEYAGNDPFFTKNYDDRFKNNDMFNKNNINAVNNDFV